MGQIIGKISIIINKFKYLSQSGWSGGIWSQLPSAFDSFNGLVFVLVTIVVVLVNSIVVTVEIFDSKVVACFWVENKA